jgi:hypothetical protein
VVIEHGFSVFSVAVMEKCCDAWLTGKANSDGVVRRRRVPVFEKQRLPSTISRRDMVGERSGNKVVFFLYLAWRLWKGALTLSVRRFTNSGEVV